MKPRASSWTKGRGLAAVACGIGLLWLCGCSEQELYARLPEHQANDMVAALRGAGIAAEKAPREGQFFALTVPRDSFTRSVEVLRDAGLPRTPHESLCDVFKKDGLVSSPAEEHARLLCALSQEIADTLSSIDGVIVARVHLSVPEKDPLAEKAPPSSASVFIKHRAGVDLGGRVGSMKALVVNAIQGLPYENVTVVLMPAESRPAGGSAAR